MVNNTCTDKPDESTDYTDMYNFGTCDRILVAVAVELVADCSHSNFDIHIEVDNNIVGAQLFALLAGLRNFPILVKVVTNIRQKVEKHSFLIFLS